MTNDERLQKQARASALQFIENVGGKLVSYTETEGPALPLAAPIAEIIPIRPAPAVTFESREAAMLWCIEKGFHVFPLQVNSKDPFVSATCLPQHRALAGGIHRSTQDPEVVKRWLEICPDMNYGINMSGYVALDVDVKGRDPGAGMRNLKEIDPPDTLVHQTPSRGLHYIYKGSSGQRDLAEGINIRSDGGYLVGPHSVINGVPYTVVNDREPAELPQRIAEKLSKSVDLVTNKTAVCETDTPWICKWCEDYMKEQPGVAQSDGKRGGRDNSAAHHARQMKDIGASPGLIESMLAIWDCENLPPLGPEALTRIAHSAWNSGKLPPGVSNPEELAAELRANPSEFVKPEPAAPSITPTPYECEDPADIPPRQWLFRLFYLRSFISATIGTGGVGKSMLEMVDALSMACGRDFLRNRQVTRKLRVWYWCGEDPQDELRRRFAAVRKHFGITREMIDGRLFVDSGRSAAIKLAADTRAGLQIFEPTVLELIKQIKANKIDVFIVDPFVSCHEVGENDNTRIDKVMRLWLRVAEEAGCAIGLVHHTRKTGGAEITVEDGRGASAMNNKLRQSRIINQMTPDEGKKAGVTNHRLYFRADPGKSNCAPAAEHAEWFHLKNVPLGNGDVFDGWQQDQIGVPVAWDWPDPFTRFTPEQIDDAKAAIEATKCRADHQSPDWVVHVAGVAMGEDTTKTTAPGRNLVKQIIATWLDAGILKTITGEDANRNKRKFVVPGPHF